MYCTNTMKSWSHFDTVTKTMTVSDLASLVDQLYHVMTVAPGIFSSAEIINCSMY